MLKSTLNFLIVAFAVIAVLAFGTALEKQKADTYWHETDWTLALNEDQSALYTIFIDQKTPIRAITEDNREILLFPGLECVGGNANMMCAHGMPGPEWFNAGSAPNLSDMERHEIGRLGVVEPPSWMRWAEAMTAAELNYTLLNMQLGLGAGVILGLFVFGESGLSRRWTLLFAIAASSFFTWRFGWTLGIPFLVSMIVVFVLNGFKNFILSGTRKDPGSRADAAGHNAGA